MDSKFPKGKSSVSLEIANNLQDKEYMGGHRDMKEGLAAQRTYTITFSAIVTDDEIYRHYLNEAETTGMLMQTCLN